MSEINNTTIPEIATIEEIKDEIVDVKTFYLSFDARPNGKPFAFKSGQFVMCTSRTGLT